MQRQGRSSQETAVHPWGKVLVPPHGIHVTVSLTSLQNEDPQQMEDVSVLHSREGHSSITSKGLRLKLQYFGHLMQKVDSLEKTQMLGKIEGRRREQQRKIG